MLPGRVSIRFLICAAVAVHSGFTFAATPYDDSLEDKLLTCSAASTVLAGLSGPKTQTDYLQQAVAFSNADAALVGHRIDLDEEVGPRMYRVKQMSGAQRGVLMATCITYMRVGQYYKRASDRAARAENADPAK